MTETADILFIDDETEILDIVQTFLARHGYRVTTFDDGRLALETVTRRDFDIVFSDLRMPEVGGIEILKAVKAAQPATEVVIVTGFGTIDTGSRRSNSGPTTTSRSRSNSSGCAGSSTASWKSGVCSGKTP